MSELSNFFDVYGDEIADMDMNSMDILVNGEDYSFGSYTFFKDGDILLYVDGRVRYIKNVEHLIEVATNKLKKEYGNDVKVELNPWLAKHLTEESQRLHKKTFGY